VQRRQLTAQPDRVMPVLPSQTVAPSTSVQLGLLAVQVLQEQAPLQLRVPAHPAPVVQLVGTPGLSHSHALYQQLDVLQHDLQPVAHV
jgi:hypothetical protein